MTENLDHTISLSAAAYDQAEATSRLSLTNRMIEAFSPAAFNATGYPVHVGDDRELWRYVDVMHETQSRHVIERVLDGLTSTEFAVFKKAAQFMVEFTRAHFGRPLRCENALLKAMNVYRYIKALDPHVVFEIGPGSGYLGLLLILDGIGYVACDNTQAFYLIQNRMWSTVAGGNFRELASEEGTLRDALCGDLKGKVVHVPWWKVVDLDLLSLPSKIDLVTANHCLAELQINAMKYYMRLAFRLLSNSKGPFAFEGWGANYLNSASDVTREFINASFRLNYEDKFITVFGTSETEQTNPPPRPGRIPHRIRNVVRSALGFATIPRPYLVGGFRGNNKYSSLIQNVRGNHHASRKYYADEIMEYLAEIYPQAEDPEEKFLRLINVRSP
jgi:hypothetical protein